MDALDVFRVGAKVGRMVDFIFEKLCELFREGLEEEGENVRCR